MSLDFIKDADNRRAICREELEALPDWFGIDAARETYISDAADQTMIAFRENGRALGMLTLTRQSALNMEIAVMGVLPAAHRRGIGSALVDEAVAFARENDAAMLSVKTIAASSPDPHYRQTRAFYEACGLDLFEVLPGLWGSSNPCAILVRRI